MAGRGVENRLSVSLISSAEPPKTHFTETDELSSSLFLFLKLFVMLFNIPMEKLHDEKSVSL